MTLAAHGAYTQLRIPTGSTTGAVDRQELEMGRRWRSLTVVEIPEALALSSAVYLHLSDSDDGIRLLHRGQRIEVVGGLDVQLTATTRVQWSADDVTGWTGDIVLHASDVVCVDLEPTGAASIDALTGTVSSTTQVSLGMADPGAVSRWVVHLAFAGWTGTVNFLGAVDADAAGIAVHYIDMSTGAVATADLDGSADVIAMVEASGLEDVLLDVTRSAGSVTYYARPVRG